MTGRSSRLDLGTFEADVLDVADDADRRNHALDGELARFSVLFDGRGDLALALLEGLDRGPGQDGHALFFEGLVGEGGNFFVFDRQYAGQHLDHGDLGAQGAVETGELDADGAGADHQQRFGQGRGDHGFLVGPDQLAVGLQARQLARPGAGRQDHVLGGDLGDRLRRPSRPGACAMPLSPSKRPWPSNTVTLFFFSRCLTPPARRAATLRERCTTFLEVDTGFLDREPIVPGRCCR